MSHKITLGRKGQTYVHDIHDNQAIRTENNKGISSRQSEKPLSLLRKTEGNQRILEEVKPNLFSGILGSSKLYQNKEQRKSILLNKNNESPNHILFSFNRKLSDEKSQQIGKIAPSNQSELNLKKDAQDQHISSFNSVPKRHQAQSVSNLPMVPLLRKLSPRITTCNNRQGTEKSEYQNDSIMLSITKRNENDSYLTLPQHKREKTTLQKNKPNFEKRNTNQFEIFDIYYKNSDMKEIKENQFINKRIERLNDIVHDKKTYINRIKKRSEYIESVTSRILDDNFNQNQSFEAITKNNQTEEASQYLHTNPNDITTTSFVDRSYMLSARCSSSLRKQDQTKLPKIHVPVTQPKTLRLNFISKSDLRKKLESATSELNELLHLRNLKHQFDKIDHERDALENAIKELLSKKRQIEDRTFEMHSGDKLIKEVEIMYNKLSEDQFEQSQQAFQAKYNFYMEKNQPKNSDYQHKDKIFNSETVLKHTHDLHVKPSLRHSQKEYANQIIHKSKADQIIAIHAKPKFLDPTNPEPDPHDSKKELPKKESPLMVLLASKLQSKPKKPGYIAGRKGRFDSIAEDPITDFDELGKGYELNHDIPQEFCEKEACHTHLNQNSVSEIISDPISPVNKFAQLMKEQNLVSNKTNTNITENIWDKMNAENTREIKMNLKASLDTKFCKNPFFKINKSDNYPNILIVNNGKNSLRKNPCIQKKLTVKNLNEYLTKSPISKYDNEKYSVDFYNQDLKENTSDNNSIFEKNKSRNSLRGVFNNVKRTIKFSKNIANDVEKVSKRRMVDLSH